MNSNQFNDRKSTTRLSYLQKNSSSSQIKRKGSSLTKKMSANQDVFEEQSDSKYLIGWGKLPFIQQRSHLQIVNKGVSRFDFGDSHLIFMTEGNKVYGIGNNKFGQLGYHQTNLNVMTTVFEDIKVSKFFCTPYATFLVNQKKQLLACGMNNRGQLGLGKICDKITIPQKIQRLSEQRQSQESKQNRQRSRMNSVYYQQFKKGQNAHQTRSHQQFSRSLSILQHGQSIIDIQGGPFHTVVLTSRGRLFYSGNLYKAVSIQNSEFLDSFIQLNTPQIGKITKIQSHLAGIGFLNCNGQLFLLGCFQNQLFQQPYMIQARHVVSFGFCDNSLYILNRSGQLFMMSYEINQIPQKIQFENAVKQLKCGMDFLVVKTQDGSLYGKGDNSQRQLKNTTTQTYTKFELLQPKFNNEVTGMFKCGNNFILAILSQPPIDTPVVQTTKIKQIQRQNRILKQLLCNKNKKNIKIQTEKESNFQMKPINARTFDASLQIPFSQLQLGKQISQGGYGVIYKATWRKSTVAVKIFKIQPENKNAIRDFASQCHAMQAMRHPNIVMFLGACTKPPHFAIVLQFCQGGTLWSLLQKQQQLPWQARRSLALDTAKGINYLHQRPVPIIHRDVKSLNLLLDHTRRVKLADFGWTKGLENYMTGKIGTYQWMAPQVISGNQYTQKADVFSFGIILWEIASRQAPYRNIPGAQVAQDVLNKDIRPVIPKSTPRAFAELIKSCWTRDPSKRPSFPQIIDELSKMSLVD